MSQMDVQWNIIASNILNYGWDEDPAQVRAVYESDKDPAPTKYIIDARMEFDGTEAPIQFGKKINPDKPFGEMDWIMIQKSNRLEDLHKKDIHFWDNWEIKEGEWKGTIGPAYGYQIGKKCLLYPLNKLNWDHLNPREEYIIRHHMGERYIILDQMDYLIQNLVNSPRSRRNVLTLWNINDIPKMKLPPCVWRSEWFVDGDNKLVLKLGARSNDFCLGNPFNVIQYYALQRMIAQVTNLGVGKMIFDLGNVHIYDRHFDGAREIIERDRTDGKAQLIIPSNIKNLYDFDYKDFKLEDYEPSAFVKFEIAE